MGLLKTVLLGAAAYGAYKYATKKDDTGRSIMDDIKDKAPEYMDKAKRFKEDIEMKYSNKGDSFTEVKP